MPGTRASPSSKNITILENFPSTNNICPYCTVSKSETFSTKTLPPKNQPSKISPLSTQKDIDPSEILNLFIKRQGLNRLFNPKAAHLKIRTKVIEWIQLLCNQLTFSEATFHSAVCYFDAVLSQFTANSNQIKLIAFTCVMLAGKMEEKKEKLPSVEEAFSFFEKEFSSSEVLSCEKIVFKILGFNLFNRNPFTFLSFFLSQAPHSTEDSFPSSQHCCAGKFQSTFSTLALSILKKSVSCYELYKFTSLAVAASALFLVRKELEIEPAWDPAMEALTRLPFSGIKDCVEMFEQGGVVSSRRTSVCEMKGEEWTGVDCAGPVAQKIERAPTAECSPVNGPESAMEADVSF